MKFKKNIIAIFVMATLNSPVFAVSYIIPDSTPANNSNQNGTISSGVDDIIIQNGTNGYESLGPDYPVLYDVISLQDAINNGFVASDIFDTANIHKLMDSIIIAEKNIIVYDNITGETHNYKVVDSTFSQIKDADTSNLSLRLYSPRIDKDYVDHTIAAISNGKTLTIEADYGLTSDWYKDEKHQVLAGHRDSNLYTASGNGSTIEYNDKINLAMGWLPSYVDNGPISVSIGNYYEWGGAINTVLGARTISDVVSFVSFNNELIAALENGTISYQDYTDSINKAYTHGYKNIPYDISKDPSYLNDPIFKGQNNSLLYGIDGAQIHLEQDSEILISNGQFSAVTVVGSSAVNDGEITGLEHYFNSMVNVLDGSEFINNGIINEHVTTDNKYSDLPVYSTSLNSTNAIYVNNASKMMNTGIINSSSISNANDADTGLITIDVQNNSSIINSGAINFGVQDVGEIISTGLNAGLQLGNNSTFYNTIDGRFSVGRSAQSDKSQTQTDVAIDSSKGRTTGISSKDSIIVNEGLFELSETTKNITLIDVIASQVQNDGVIKVEGIHNVGINAMGSDTADNDTLIINNGSFLIQKGEDIKGIKANNVNGKGAIQIQNTSNGVITIDGNNSFTSGSNLVRNYGIWVEGKNATGINDGLISLIDGGAIGIHARNSGIVHVNSNSLMTFAGQGNQIGYFAYGDGSVIQFNNPTKPNNIDSKNSNFARVENGANLIFVNNPSESTEINLNADNTLGFHISGNSTGFLADSNINLNLIGDDATGFLASNGGSIEISDSMKTMISGNDAIFAIADGKNYKIDNTIVDGEGYVSSIISSAIINDSIATGNGIIGYLANQGGVIYHQGIIDLQNKGDATGIKIDGGSVINTGSVSVNGIGVHVIGNNSNYQGSNTSLVKATDGNAAFFIDKNAKLKLVGGNVEASKNAHGILVDSQASELSVANAILSSDGGGDVIHNNADITVTIKNSILNALGNNSAIGHNANNATYKLDGALIKAESISQNAVNFSVGNGILDANNTTHIIGSIITNASAVSDVSFANGSRWDVLFSSSNVTNLTNTTGSVIDLTSKTNGVYNVLTVENNYIGGDTQPSKNNLYPTNNGSLIVNTIWNNADSDSDLLHIMGSASGYTSVTTKNGIIGDVTLESSDKFSATVVTVDNHSLNSNNFYGFANTTGAGQAILVQKDANNYAWYLPAKSEDPITPVNPINPTVPGAVLMPKANLNAGYSILGTLHERVSEQQTMAWDDCSTCQIENNDGQVWGRFIGNYNKIDGQTQYDYRSKLWGAQFGYDFAINYDKDYNSRSHTGVMFTYAKDNLSFYNANDVYFNTIIGDYAEKNRQTGHGQSDIYSLGAYHTYYDKNGSYLDLVGMFNYIQNKYTTYDWSTDKNHTYGLILSTEVGRPFAITNNGLHNGDWLIEPQAQLIYQYLKYSDYETVNNLKIDQHNQQGLRGRLGARLAYNQGNDELKTQTFYISGNIIHDFLNQKQIDFGVSKVNEKTAKTLAEIGMGFQLPLTDKSYIYFDTRYYHSLGSSDGTTKAFSGTLGLKYYW